LGKNNFLNHLDRQKTNIATVCMLGMLVGFLVSRATLSLSMFLFGVNALWNVHPRNWLKNNWWLLGIAWVLCYVVSGLWSANHAEWHTRVEVKLPVLLLPLAFAYLPRFTPRQLQLFTVGAALILMAGAAYSVSFLINHTEFYKEEYRVSHTLPTPVKQDHIRFSLAIALFIIWCVNVWRHLGGRMLRVFVAVSMLLLATYLHILAAKTGIIALYTFLAAWGIYLAVFRRSFWGIAALLSIVVIITLAINFIPTFLARWHYMKYTYIVYKQGDKSGLYGDINRYMSYDVAIRYIKQYPLQGVGVGDMMNTMKEGYAQWYPQVPDENKLMPHNQFLTVALGCGIPAVLVFLAWAVYPFFRIRKGREGFFFFVVLLLLFLQLLIEPVLEVQYGVFVYLFFLLLFWHHMQRSKEDGQGLKSVF
jgi:O-antigen ligase